MYRRTAYNLRRPSFSSYHNFNIVEVLYVSQIKKSKLRFMYDSLFYGFPFLPFRFHKSIPERILPCILSPRRMLPPYLFRKEALG